MSARIVTDVFTEYLRALDNPCVNDRIYEAKITLSGATVDLYTPNRAFVYDSASTPYTSSWMFYGTFEVTQDNTTVDEIIFRIRTQCGQEYIVLRIIATQPVTLNKGFYGVLLAYEYRAPSTVNVVLR